MKKKVVLLLLTSITCFAMLTACGRMNEENQDPLTGQEQTTEIETESVPLNDQVGMGDEFNNLLNQPNDSNGVIDYINTNIGTAMADDVDRFFTGLLGYGDNIRDIDFSRLEESRQHMPEDMVAFVDLMKLESEAPSMKMSNTENRMEIGLTLSEMLERALLFEKHIEKYPNHVTTEAATKLYEEIATHAITGGYDKTAGVEHYYKGETADVVDKEALTYYQQFAEANPDTRLGQVVKEYTTLLQENNFQLNEKVEDFYYSLHQRLKPAATENQTGVAGESGSAGNGTGNAAGTTNGNGTGNASEGVTGVTDSVMEGTR